MDVFTQWTSCGLVDRIDQANLNINISPAQSRAAQNTNLAQ